MGSDIRKAREILRAGLASGDDAHLRAAVSEALSMMTKVFIKRKAPARSAKMTPAVATEVCKYYAQNPHLSVNAIGARFGVNGGRVSEAIHGHWRDPEWVEKTRGWRGERGV